MAHILHNAKFLAELRGIRAALRYTFRALLG